MLLNYRHQMWWTMTMSGRRFEVRCDAVLTSEALVSGTIGVGEGQMTPQQMYM